MLVEARKVSSIYDRPDLAKSHHILDTPSVAFWQSAR
jgi:hypothetical protein